MSRGAAGSVRAVALAGLVLASRALGAQDVSARGAVVTVAVSRDTVAVGEPFVVRVRVRAPKSATLRFPALPDSGDAVEALDPRAVEEAPDESVLDQTAVYRVAAWNVGSHAAHFAPVTVSMAGSAVAYPIVVPPVYVAGVLPADTAQQVPKDAREPFPAISGLWRWLLVLAIVATLGAWYLVRRRRTLAVTPRAAPEAYVAASSAFRALEGLALADAGETGRHVIAHVDVLRAYLARRFPAAGVALTPAEMHAALAASDFPLLPERVDDLLARDGSIRFAHVPVPKAEALALAAEARAIARDVQDAYEARLRAAERGPQRPARR